MNAPHTNTAKSSFPPGLNDQGQGEPVDTRTRILETGGRLVHAKGFNNTGLSEILRAANVPKGSFYHYFPSKEEFGLALVDYHLGFLRQTAIPYLTDESYAPLDRLRSFFGVFIDQFESANFENGCPVGNLVQEMSSISEVFRKRLGELLSPLESAVAGLLEQAREAGDTPRHLDVRRTARFILSSWQGAVMMMKLTRRREPLEIFQEMVFVQLLAKPNING